MAKAVFLSGNRSKLHHVNTFLI